MNQRTKTDLQRQYLYEMRRYEAEAERQVRVLGGDYAEKLGWLERVDETVDEIARRFGLEIPYGADSKNWRYNPVYRLEMLREQLIERQEGA